MAGGQVHVTGKPLGIVSPNLFSALVEHFGCGLYGGIRDVEKDGPRRDVLDQIRGLAPGLLRWPGGCFSSSYEWRDGIGPKDKRPQFDTQYWTNFHEIAAGAGIELSSELASRFGPPEPNVFGT